MPTMPRRKVVPDALDLCDRPYRPSIGIHPGVELQPDQKLPVRQRLGLRDDEPDSPGGHCRPLRERRPAAPARKARQGPRQTPQPVAPRRHAGTDRPGVQTAPLLHALAALPGAGIFRGRQAHAGSGHGEMLECVGRGDEVAERAGIVGAGVAERGADNWGEDGVTRASLIHTIC